MIDNELEKLKRQVSMQNCPSCKGELEEGYLPVGTDIRWDTKKHKYAVSGAEFLTPFWHWSVINLPALRCNQCKIVIFSYEEQRQE